jgi:hypothetical protein
VQHIAHGERIYTAVGWTQVYPVMCRRRGRHVQFCARQLGRFRLVQETCEAGIAANLVRGRFGQGLGRLEEWIFQRANQMFSTTHLERVDVLVSCWGTRSAAARRGFHRKGAWLSTLSRHVEEGKTSIHSMDRDDNRVWAWLVGTFVNQDD